MVLSEQDLINYRYVCPSIASNENRRQMSNSAVSIEPQPTLAGSRPNLYGFARQGPLSSYRSSYIAASS